MVVEDASCRSQLTRLRPIFTPLLISRSFYTRDSGIPLTALRVLYRDLYMSCCGGWETGTEPSGDIGTRLARLA